jgi:hypothetical protein
MSIVPACLAVWRRCRPHLAVPIALAYWFSVQSISCYRINTEPSWQHIESGKLSFMQNSTKVLICRNRVHMVNSDCTAALHLQNGIGAEGSQIGIPKYAYQGTMTIIP